MCIVGTYSLPPSSLSLASFSGLREGRRRADQFSMPHISFDASLPARHFSSHEYFVDRRSRSSASKGDLRLQRAREFSRRRDWQRSVEFMERAQECLHQLLEQMDNDLADDPTIVNTSHWLSALMHTERQLTRIYLFGQMPDALFDALRIFFHVCHPEAVAIRRAPHLRKTVDILSSLEKGAHLKPTSIEPLLVSLPPRPCLG